MCPKTKRQGGNKMKRNARLPKGEKYHFIDDCGFVGTEEDNRELQDDLRYKVGNYFPFGEEEEAESVAKRFFAVLKGAEVIDVTTANVGSADELDAKKHQIELILSHRQTIVIAENNGVLNWCWNTKSIDSRNEMLETTIRANKLKFYGAILDRYDPR